MQISYRTLIKHIPSGQFLDKLAKGKTTSHSQAIRFSNEDDARQFLHESRYAPVNRDEFELATIKITSELVEDTNV